MLTILDAYICKLTPITLFFHSIIYSAKLVNLQLAQLKVNSLCDLSRPYYFTSPSPSPSPSSLYSFRA